MTHPRSGVFPLRHPDRWVRTGRFIRADITDLPVRDLVAGEVVGRKLPTMSDADRSAVVREAVRILVPGGVLRLHPSSGGGALWLPFLEAQRLDDFTIEGIYATRVKPRSRRHLPRNTPPTGSPSTQH